MLEIAHGHPRSALSLKARDGEECGGRAVVPELSFPLKINPPGLQIAGCLTCGQLPRARIPRADIAAAYFRQVLTSGGQRRVPERGMKGTGARTGETGEKKSPRLWLSR
jgi:hypothetical protein